MNVKAKRLSASGLNPTDFKTFLFSPAPIRNKVIVKPILEAKTKCGPKSQFLAIVLAIIK
jgi:hypothetical protein